MVYVPKVLIITSTAIFFTNNQAYRNIFYGVIDHDKVLKTIECKNTHVCENQHYKMWNHTRPWCQKKPDNRRNVCVWFKVKIFVCFGMRGTHACSHKFVNAVCVLYRIYAAYNSQRNFLSRWIRVKKLPNKELWIAVHKILNAKNKMVNVLQQILSLRPPFHSDHLRSSNPQISSRSL